MTTTPCPASGEAAASERFAFELAENVRAYRVLTLTLDPDDAARVRALIAADDGEGLRRFLDAHAQHAEVRESCAPGDLDTDDARDPNLLSVWTPQHGPRDVFWEC